MPMTPRLFAAAGPQPRRFGHRLLAFLLLPLLWLGNLALAAAATTSATCSRPRP